MQKIKCPKKDKKGNAEDNAICGSYESKWHIKPLMINGLKGGCTMAEVLFDYKEKPEADGLVTKFLDELTVAEQEQFLAFMQGFQFAKKSETVQTA